MIYFTKVFVLLSLLCVAIAAPYQELPPKPGYVPVYIRVGNTSLKQINPKLVEAFHDDEDEEFIVIQNEPETPKKLELANSDKINQATESTKKGEEKRITKVQQLNGDGDGDGDNNKKVDKSRKETEKLEKEAITSDIAEFTSDDVKTLYDDLIGNKTK